MKKIIAIISIFVLTMQALPVKAGRVVLICAPDGREAYVEEETVEAYVRLGWSSPYYRVTETLYSLDGRTADIDISEVNDYIAVGWFQEYTTMYSPDGRAMSVHGLELGQYYNNGWRFNQSEVVQKLYDMELNCISVYKNEVPAYLKVGWMLPDQALNIFADKYVNEYLASNDYENAIECAEGACELFEGDDYWENMQYRIRVMCDSWRESIRCPLVCYGSEGNIDEKGKTLVTIWYRNLSYKTIVAFLVEYECYDAYLYPNDGYYGFNYYGGVSELQLYPTESDYITMDLSKKFPGTKYIRNIKITKVIYDDGTYWGI